MPVITNRRGFTLIEMMIVMAIIIILASLVLGAASILRNRTKRLISTGAMDSLSTAISVYLGESGSFGTKEIGTHFIDKPLDQLFYHRKEKDLVAVAGKSLMKRIGADWDGPFIMTNSEDATHYADGFDQPILIRVTNEGAKMPDGSTSNSRVRSTEVVIWSRSGTPDIHGDDDVIVLREESSDWRRVKIKTFNPTTGEFTLED